MADSSNFVLKAYKTEANARADANPLAVDSITSSSGSVVDNPSQASGYGFWAFQRYWYRIEANEPVSTFYIDWDDGEDNSPKKANVSIIKNDKPSFVGIVSHIYTQSKKFYPLIRVKSVEGFLSKWYTPYAQSNAIALNTFSGLDDDIKATAGNTTATTTITLYGTILASETITIISTDGTSKTYTATTNESSVSPEFYGGNESGKDVALQLKDAIEHANGHGSKITITKTGLVLTLTQAVTGKYGNTPVTISESFFGSAPDFSGGSGSVTGEIHDSGQNAFSVVSIEKNDGSTAYARIPILEPANVPPIGVLKTDRKKVFAGMDNVWLGNNSRVLKGIGATEMPYSSSVHALCSNPNRIGAQAKVTYQEGRIGGVSAISEVTTTSVGDYEHTPGGSKTGFTADDLDQKVIYIRSMDETYGCFFKFPKSGTNPTIYSNAQRPIFEEPYTNAVPVEIEISAESAGLGTGFYCTAQDYAEALAGVLNDETGAPGIYHGRDEFTTTSTNASSSYERFLVVVTGDSFENTDTTEKAPAPAATADDGLTTAASDILNYGNYFTFSTPNILGIPPVNYYMWFKQNPKVETFIIECDGNSFNGTNEIVYAPDGSGSDDGLTTHVVGTYGNNNFGNYFTFSTLDTNFDEVDYYAWFRQDAVNEELTVRVSGDSFSSNAEKSALSGDDGLTTWAGSPSTPVGNYFQFKFQETDYIIWFRQAGISEQTLFEFATSFDGTLQEASLEDAYTIVYDTAGDGWLAYFETGTDEGGDVPDMEPAVPYEFVKEITLSGGATQANAATALYNAYNDYNGWSNIGLSTSTPFTATNPSAGRCMVTCDAVGNTTDGLDGQVPDDPHIPPRDGQYITTTTSRQGRDEGTTPAGWHAFTAPYTEAPIGYLDTASETDVATALFNYFDSGGGSSITGLSVERDGVDVKFIAQGSLTNIKNLSNGTAFTSQDGFASGGYPNAADLSTDFTFLVSPQGKNQGKDPATRDGDPHGLSGKTGIVVPYGDGNPRTTIATKLVTALASGIPVAEREAPSASGKYVTVKLKNAGAVTHAADGTTASNGDEGSMNLSSGCDVITSRIDGKNTGQDPGTPHYFLLNGMTGIPIPYADGDTKEDITDLMFAAFNKGCDLVPPDCVYPWTVTKPTPTSVQVTMDEAGTTTDILDGSTSGGSPSVDLHTGFTFSIPQDATGRYKLTTTHINKGVIPAAAFNSPFGAEKDGTDGLICTSNDLFERADSTANPPTYYAPRLLTDGVDPSDGTIKQKTLTCGIEFSTNSKLSNVAKILKMELVNNLENTDSYGGSTGTSTLVPGERIYLQTTLALDADNTFPTGEDRLNNLNLCGTLCSVSLGSPIVEENLIGSKLSVDATESKVRCSNKSISYFYIDDNKLISGDVEENSSSHQAADDYNITDKLVGGADFKSTSGTKDLWYTFDWWREHQDANYRYYPYKRLIRTQIEDSHGNSVADDAFNMSPIVHFDSSSYLSVGSAANLADGQPSDISKWNYGLFLFTNQAKLRTPNWVDLSANNREDRIAIFCSDAVQETSNKLGNSSAFDDISTAPHYAPDNRYDAKATEDMDAIDSVGPRNALFMARKEKFDRIFVRVSHDRFNAGGRTIAVTEDTTGLVSDITVGSTTGWPKMRTQVLYPAKKTRNSSTIIWKPLPIIDRTMLEGKEDSSFYKSGDMIFIPPADWEKTYHSTDIEYPYEDNFFDDGTTSGTNGIDDKWNKASYALIFLITHIDSDGDGGGVERIKNVFNVMSMYPYNNSHSQLIEVVDPTHVSLNKFGIAQSVSFVRKGKYQEIKDRSGISLMRRVGAEGGKFKLGGIDLKGDPESTRAKFNEFQKDGVPVYYDILHKDDSITRLFGVMTDMSEDHPTADLIPKFACSLTVTHILEIDSSGNIEGKGYKPLGGDAIDVEQYLSTS